MKKQILIPSLIFCATAGAFAATKILTLSGGAKFEVNRTKNGYEYANTTTRFFVNHVYPDADQLFKVTEREVTQTQLDGVDAKSVIESYSSKKSPFDTKGWTLKVNGGDFQIYNEDFARVTSYGCCDSPDRHSMISMKAGKIVTVALNQSTYSFEVPNSKLARRYLGEIEDLQAPQKKGEKSYIGSIAYFSAERVFGVIRVYAQLQQGWGASMGDFKLILKTKDEIRAQAVTLWSADFAKDAKVAFSGIGLSSEVYLGSAPAHFKVMLQEDALSLSKSQADPGIELVLAGN